MPANLGLLCACLNRTLHWGTRDQGPLWDYVDIDKTDESADLIVFLSIILIPCS